MLADAALMRSVLLGLLANIDDPRPISGPSPYAINLLDFQPVSGGWRNIAYKRLKSIEILENPRKSMISATQGDLAV